MKYYSEADIEQMRKNGYEAVTIEKARKIQMCADMLISEICGTFKGVKLKDGVGLNEAQGLDDYEDKTTCKKLRGKDEKDEWQKIPPKELNRCNSSLSFFDPKGMRFHLPAFMIADIKDEFDYGMAFCLSDLSDYSEKQFSILAPEERKVVKLFLEYMCKNEEYSFEWPNIQRSVEAYWSK